MSHLEVWKQFEFSILVQIARDFLPIPASSAAPERVFNQRGDLYHEKAESNQQCKYTILGNIVGDDNFDEKEEQKESDLGEVDE